MTEKEKYQIATKKVKRIKKFHKSLSSYIFTSIFLLVLFFFIRIPFFVTLIVIGSWGLAVAYEAVEIFGFPGTGEDWEQRRIDEEVERMNRRERSKETYHGAGHGNKISEEDILELPDYQEVKRTWKDSDLV